ncbi:MAG: recombination-associated protein RdgC [Deltaproteobacteria bacterium]|nr:recombination-associated protein RdgC [Deltaproteobacteria bacterium]RLB82966.1 MAG: exonuclease [Deltaproteobacteria bacterium]
MGLLSSTVSITRYRVEGRLEEPVPETMAKCLKKNAIPDIDDDVSDKTVGWTSFDKPFNPDFESSSFLIGTYFVFSLRIDKKTVPPSLIKKHCAMETARRLAATGRKYLSRDEKRMIKEHVTSVLTLRIPATPSVYDLIWNYEESVLWFFSTLKSANDELETLFFRSFQLPLIRLFPYTTADLVMGLSDTQRDILVKLSATDFTE